MSKNIPDGPSCVNILKKAGCRDRVIIHCCTVCAVAEEMLGKIDADKELVIAGSLLHDIGRSKDHSITHAMTGGDMLSSLGLPEDLVKIVKKHTGAGLDSIDVAEMNLPPGDYIPRTIEEKLVAHADNLVSDNRVISHKQSVDRLRERGALRGADRMEALHWELSKLYGMDLDIIRDIIGEYPKLKWI
ncbi:ribonuclease Y [Candidatus Methanoplasma termitum]|uniref:Rny protein n=1 Tax=Candidatus Methanoplasma termitum TaxID=1577791 RepID=A0A0A7LG33_9ARCH|nr:HDIG domain-containing metalloprotein [Candidatus Methanoplasma termitum]AIZ57257.1 ribonuclease Y [Candidatus Methanoplasma termitum]